MPSGPGVPNFTAPSPTPQSSSSQHWPAVMPYAYGPIQTAAYHPNYHGYAPVNNQGYPGYYAAPAYYPTPAYSYSPPAYWYGGSQ
jgi:hypothetical protein